MNFNLKEGSLAPVQRPMYSPGGSFIVTRAVIRRNPLSYYMRIVKSPLLNTLNDPPLGHILEWAWNDVFHSKCATDEKFICYGLTRTRTSAWLRGWWNQRYKRRLKSWEWKRQSPPTLSFPSSTRTQIISYHKPFSLKVGRCVFFLKLYNRYNNAAEVKLLNSRRNFRI